MGLKEQRRKEGDVREREGGRAKEAVERGGLTIYTCCHDKYICLSSDCHSWGNIYLVNDPITM